MAEEKKFTPIQPSDLKGNQRQKVQFVMDDWKHNPVVDDLHGEWIEEIAWFEGFQYTYWSKNAAKLDSTVSEVDREFKNVYNRIFPIVRQIHGEIRYPHTFYVEPNTTEALDIKAADMGSRVVEYTNSNTYGRFHKKIDDAKWWAIITGNAFWKEWWNKNLFGFQFNEKSKKATKVPGNLDFDVVSPFNIRLDSFNFTRNKWGYIIEGKRLPKEMVEAEFGLKAGTLPAEKLKGGKAGLFERPDESKPKDVDTIIRMEFYEAPYSGWEKGRMMVIAGGWLLWEGVSPNPEGEIGHFHIPGICPKLNSQWYQSAVRHMMPAQKRVNRYGSMMDEYIHNFRPKCLISGEPFKPGEFERYARAGVEYVFLNVGMEKPIWQDPPQMSEQILRWFSTQEDDVETSVSVRKPSLAKWQKGVRGSGVMFEGLKAQDERVLLPTAENIDGSLEDAMSYRLKLAQKHYDEKRLIKMTGKNKRTVAAFVTGVELRDNSDVRVKAGIEIFSDKMAKKEVIMAFVQQQQIASPREAFELMGYKKEVGDYYAEQFVDDNQAYRENDIMKEAKTYPEPHEDDNHEVHLRIHDLPRKSEEFDTWSDKAKTDLKKHKAKHKELSKPAEPTPEEAVEGEEVIAPESTGPVRAADMSEEQLAAEIQAAMKA